jgi:hypothetical protein
MTKEHPSNELLNVWRIILRHHAQGYITPAEEIQNPLGAIQELISMGIVDCGEEGYWLNKKHALWFDCIQHMVLNHPLVDVARAEAAYHDDIVRSAGHPRNIDCGCPLCKAVRKMPDRLPGAIPRYRDPEEMKLRMLVKDFSESMLKRLLQKCHDGWRGWDDNSKGDLEENFWQRLNEHVGRWKESPGNTRDIIDTANFCAFIWNLRRK